MQAVDALKQSLQGFFKRRAGSHADQWQLNNRNIYIFPSKFGLLYIALMAVLLIFATNYANNLIYLISFSLAGIGVMSIVFTYKNLNGLSIAFEKTEPTFAGEAAHIILKADIPNRSECWCLDFSPAPSLSFDIKKPNQRLRIPIETTIRGLYPIDRIRLRTSYPFGLLTAWAYIYPSGKLVVYPKPEENAPTPSGIGAENIKGNATQQGDADFVGHKRYRPGDSLTHAYWPSLAKGQELQVKQFATPVSHEQWLYWNATEGLDTEQRLSRLCQWILWSDAQKLPYGLAIPGINITPATGEEHKRRCLGALASFGFN